jgi:hypothetical protein
MTDLHAAIMNLQAPRTKDAQPIGWSPSYLEGHRDARHAAAELVSAALAPAVPPIGQPWPAQGGIYAGLSRGEDGEPDAHLVLLPDVLDKDMAWADAVKWAEGLGNGARLPTRFESALLCANLRDQLDTDHWHWTGTPDSEGYAWYQYLYHGYQYSSGTSFGGRARAVRLIPVAPSAKETPTCPKN